MKFLFALMSGLLFGAGLSLSGMTDPQKVKGFLDISGNWDPSLAFVMGGALFVGLLLFPLVTNKKKPLFENSFSMPTKLDIDKGVILGPALFGIGWGLIGLCPGPAFASLLYQGKPIIVFTVVMLISKLVTDKLKTN